MSRRSAFFGNTPEQKEFLKIYDSLTGSHSRWEVWKDMCVLFATSISNVFDKRYYDQREQLYMSTINNRYTKEQQQRFVDLFAALVNGMNNDMERGGPEDFLGEMFMALDLGNDAGGQFFTPSGVSKVMARITLDKDMVRAQIEKHGYISMNDPACGAGVTLIAALNVLHEMGINYQQSVIVTAQDIDFTTAMMCYIQLSFLGASGYVYIGNTLSEPDHGSILHGGCNNENTWFTPMWFSDTWETRRTIDRMGRVLRASSTGGSETAIPHVSEKDAGCNRVSDEPREKAVKTPQIEKRSEECTLTVGENGQMRLLI